MATIQVLRAGRWITTLVPIANWEETVCTILEDTQVCEYRVEDEAHNLLEHALVGPVAQARFNEYYGLQAS